MKTDEIIVGMAFYVAVVRIDEVASIGDNRKKDIQAVEVHPEANVLPDILTTSKIIRVDGIFLDVGIVIEDGNTGRNIRGLTVEVVRPNFIDNEAQNGQIVGTV